VFAGSVIGLEESAMFTIRAVISFKPSESGPMDYVK
jgi:hypothetical protein